MIDAQNIYDCIAGEMDGVATADLPDEKEFAKEVAAGVKEGCYEGQDAMTIISEYTRYVCNRVYGKIEPRA